MKIDYETLPPDYKKTFSRAINLLKFIGIDLFNSSGISANSMIRLFVTNVLFLPFFYGQLCLVAEISADKFLEGSRCVPICIFGVLCMIKLASAFVKKSEIKRLLLEMSELWPRGLEVDDEKAVIKETWMRRMGTLVNAFFIYVLVNVFAFVFIPLLTTVYNMCAGVNEFIYPVQMVDLWVVDSVTTYLASYVWVVAATVPYQMCLYLPYDLLIITTTSNLSILLRLLQVDLINSIQARDDDETRQEVHTPDPESYERIVKIVCNHQKLLRISDQLSHIFGFVIFVHVGFSSILICFFGFLTVVFGGLAETIANLLTVWNAVIAIFLVSLSGQLLCDTTSGVAEAAYQSKWYKSDMKVKKLVHFIIIRSQKTCYLSALGFTEMTLSSFSKIMSSAWTYFSFLVQMYEEN